MCLKENNLNLHVCPILFIIILSSPFSLFSLSSLSLSELLGDLLNGAFSTPVSTTMVVGRDLFFGEWMDKVNFGGEGVPNLDGRSIRIAIRKNNFSLLLHFHECLFPGHST